MRPAPLFCCVVNHIPASLGDEEHEAVYIYLRDEGRTVNLDSIIIHVKEWGY